MDKKNFDIIIIGAGASGMMAAITAARNDKRVLLLEQMDKVGKKILATGNGKCNYTNENMELSNFRGDSQLIKNVLNKFSKEDCLNFFKEIGIYPKCKNGYYYPNSEQAASVQKALLMEMQNCNINLLTDVKISAIKNINNRFYISLNNENYTGDRLIVATGLLANPKLGSDGSIFPIIKKLGHSFTSIVPALCGFQCKGFKFSKAQGVRAEAVVTAMVEGKTVAFDKGEVQFADYGLSGIPVFQVSHFLSQALHDGKKCKIVLDLFPDLTEEELQREISYRFSNNQNYTVDDNMNGLLNQTLINPICLKCNIDSMKRSKKITEAEQHNLAVTIKNLEVDVEQSRGYSVAQVCAGGIKTKEIDNNTLESKYIKGLYFAGEILDVDGICGGYNLQWAWSSGYVAGTAASR